MVEFYASVIRWQLNDNRFGRVKTILIDYVIAMRNKWVLTTPPLQRLKIVRRLCIITSWSSLVSINDISSRPILRKVKVSRR